MRLLQKIYLVLILLVIGLFTSCTRQSKTSKTQDFFIDWLKAHGETNITVDAKGVGIAGNPTRLKAKLWSSKKHPNETYAVETEFRIRLPEGRELIEYVAGMGDNEDKATQDSLVNFTLSTFHVIYKSFINPADPHQATEKVMINGASRELVMGDMYMRSEESSEKLELTEVGSQIKTALLTLPLNNQPHWVKIVYFQQNGRPMTVSATLDNHEQEFLTSSIKALKWPVTDKFYIVKQFIIIK